MGSSLFKHLRQGEFDFVFGRIDEAIDPHEFSADVLFNDSLVVVARRDHPLVKARAASKANWDEIEWILPSGDNPARTASSKRSARVPERRRDARSTATAL
jgi:DNA-binding transcriptional LysR family regulator